MDLNFLLDDVIKNRRALHQIPEVGLKEYQTKEYLKKLSNFYRSYST